MRYLWGIQKLERKTFGSWRYNRHKIGCLERETRRRRGSSSRIVCFHLFPSSILSFLRASQIWNSSSYFPSLEESKSRRRRHLINHQRRISAVLAYCADFLKQDFWSRFVDSCGRLLEARCMCGLQHHPQARISEVRKSNLQGNRSDLLFNTYIRCSIETCDMINM